MRFRRTLVSLAVALTGVAVPVAGAPGIACAAEGPRAVLVVDTGEGAHHYCVALGKEKVSGIEVIKLAAAQHGLDYALGHGGAAVCRLAGVGPDGGDCFAEHPYFWGYWRGDGGGGWTWSSTGAASSVVTDGAVEGWSWGTGDSGASHPPPPATTFSSVCAKAAPPRPEGGGKSGTPAPAPAASSTPVVAPSQTAPSEESGGHGDVGPRERGSKDRGDKRKGTRAGGPAPPAPAPAETAEPSSAPVAAARAGSDGPPAAGLFGLAVALGLGLAGAWMVRRRRHPPGKLG